MTKIAKIFFLLAIFSGVMLTGFADRGIGKKSKAKVALNIASISPSRGISFNLKSGVQYKGSLLNNVSTSGSSVTYNTLITFQKGNTIYILPYKQKILIPEIKQGYTGLKLILKTN
ncbi:MAG: hypothetical protein ABIY51_03855 [Ferruginibacter sp.]